MSMHGGAPGYAKAWGCWEVPKDLILFASPSLSRCQSNAASPGALAGAAQGRDGPCRGEGGSPHPPRAAPMSRAASLGSSELGRTRHKMFQKGKEREETRVDSWWMFFHGHLQTSCCSSAVLSHLFVCSTPAEHPAARDPPPAEHTGVGWSDWESLRVKGWLAQRGCWSMWCGTGTPAALLPCADRGAHVQVMVATHIPRHRAELSLPPRMLGRCDSR